MANLNPLKCDTGGRMLEKLGISGKEQKRTTSFANDDLRCLPLKFLDFGAMTVQIPNNILFFIAGGREDCWAKQNSTSETICLFLLFYSHSTMRHQILFGRMTWLGLGKCLKPFSLRNANGLTKAYATWKKWKTAFFDYVILFLSN